MKYKTVLFDLDGTLIDTTKGVINAVKKTIVENGFVMPDEEKLTEFVGPPMQKTMGEQFGLNSRKALEVANEFRSNYKKHYLFQASVYEGILPLIMDMREAKYNIAVATNKSHQNAVDILDKFGIAEYCNYIRGSDLEGKLSKNDIIDLCIEKIGCKKEEVVLIGDSIFDLKGAEKSEIDFVGVTYGFGFKIGEPINSNRCVYIANNVEELRAYLLFT